MKPHEKHPIAYRGEYDIPALIESHRKNEAAEMAGFAKSLETLEKAVREGHIKRRKK